jgi:hypothetical protein
MTAVPRKIVKPVIDLQESGQAAKSLSQSSVFSFVIVIIIIIIISSS